MQGNTKNYATILFTIPKCSNLIRKQKEEQQSETYVEFQ